MKRKIIILLGVTALALAARLLYLSEYSSSVLFSTIVGADVEDYWRWAQRILAGEFIYRQLPIHPPAYAYFLALLVTIFKNGFFTLRLTQSFLCFLSFLPLYGIVEKHNNRRTAVIFLVLAALSPMLIFYQCESYSEGLLLIALNLTIYFLCKYDAADSLSRRVIYAAAAALTSALAVLTHSMALVFVLFEFVYLFVKIRKNKNPLPQLTALMFFAACLTPVAIHNSRLAGTFIFTQGNSAFNFYLGNSAEATGLCPLRTGAQWDKMHYQAAAATNNEHIDRYFLHKSLDWISDHPFKWLYLELKKAFYVWNFRNYPSGYDLDSITRYTPFQRFGRFLDIFIIFSALSFLLLKLRDRRFFFASRHFMLLLAGFYLAQIITLSAGRYRLGMYPPLLLLSAGFIDYLAARIKEKKFSGRWIAFGASLVFAATIVFLPLPRSDQHSDESWAESTLAEAYMRCKDFSNAEIHAANAVRSSDENDRAYMILALCAMQKNHFPLASRLFEKALAINEYSYQAHINLALCAMRQGDRYLAQGIFLKCLKRWPRNPTVLYNYAYFLLRCNQTAPAAVYLRRTLKYDPANGRAWNALGIIELNARRYPEAVDCFQKALSRQTSDFGIRFNLAAAQAQAGMFDEAMRNVSELERQRPGDENVLKLRRALKAMQSRQRLPVNRVK